MGGMGGMGGGGGGGGGGGRPPAGGRGGSGGPGAANAVAGAPLGCISAAVAEVEEDGGLHKSCFGSLCTSDESVDNSEALAGRCEPAFAGVLAYVVQVVVRVKR